jgi:fluoride ion exporter CrcB/FEX
MKKLYILSGACGALASITSFILYTLSQGDNINLSLVLGFSVVGIILGIFPIYKLKNRIQSNISKRTFLYLEINLFIGIIFAFIAGLLGSWLLVFPFGLLFGHPDAGWAPLVKYLFLFLSGVLFIFSVLFLPAWFIGIIDYSGRKNRHV